ncbi:MAG: tripartite tricarboxylate transporter substrate binding protein [Rhodocyclaceae bacterium]|jgi:tripartite-type tricarboxylate transporter receptor subunit TctC|nr:tripartite tricarboxylate transporter substrate binding protein [Rhodocyclaceae bacterium]MCE2978319.1 tripartite tricarboxylate transporter substrate binding protein [Betaproteobacteria bacterium]MCA3075385.1 tripartite tricarboxylate transporter substrate binding protein [Rhodocyclaceae bacterium]MCA3091870.1 tripartite tricarboxylate transporter substrate binding protein [Rhodocyclaceae bacterium]MCA3093236.1 tripartite tricarboxylate transporter substrate binding protein [Rhodocyclaceae 
MRLPCLNAWSRQPGRQWLAAAMLLLAAGTGAAAGYPDRPIRLIMGFPPGSTVDILARPVAQRLSEAFGQPVIVDNRSGATGIIANELVARAQPDGYTLLAAPSSSLTSTPHLAARLPYDALRDFVAVAQLSAFGYVLVVNPAVPAKNLRELMALANTRPDGLTYGSSGTGSGFHLAGELFQRLGKVKLLHVPYKGGPPGVTDLMAGRIDFMFYSLAVIHPQIRAGKLRVIAVTAPQRDPLLPDVPTMAEGGVPGYEATGWHGIFAPGGTPRAVVGRLNAEVIRILGLPDVRDIWAQQGMGITSADPARLAQRMRDDYEFYGKLIRAAGIKSDGS